MTGRSVVSTSADTVPGQTPVCLYLPAPDRHDGRGPLAGAVEGEFTARIVGYRLYRAAMLSMHGDPVGFVVPERGFAIVGRVFVIRPGRYAQVLQQLDAVYGYRDDDPASRYLRRCATVDVVVGRASVSVEAWLYAAGEVLASCVGIAEPVRFGDWATLLPGADDRDTSGAPVPPALGSGTR